MMKKYENTQKNWTNRPQLTAEEMQLWEERGQALCEMYEFYNNKQAK